jgi:VIT1/CCC1 family predicted Fe2+/Mn2+ transporter
MPQRSRAEKYRELWEDELAGAALYRTLADAARDDQNRREVLERLAEAEERHAAHWEKMLVEEGVGPLPRPRVPLRVKVLGRFARWFGVESVLPLVLRLEAADASRYDRVPEAAPGMAGQERAHGRVVAALGAETAGSRIASAERRHRVGAGGALRASVFGLNDGLVSNLSLVMGVAGGTSNARIILLAGIAGLVAGAFSMATGEWVSVRSQRELYEREIEIEREELETFPEEEREELALIYRAKGIDPFEARALATRMMKRPEVALDTLVREELGLDPAGLGSPWVAAGSSFVSFALGALIPVVPYIVGSGNAAFAAAAACSAVTLFGAGVAISIFTGRRPTGAGLRMVGIGALGATATYFIGRAIGVSISG